LPMGIIVAFIYNHLLNSFRSNYNVITLKCQLFKGEDAVAVNFKKLKIVFFTILDFRKFWLIILG